MLSISKYNFTSLMTFSPKVTQIDDDDGCSRIVGSFSRLHSTSPLVAEKSDARCAWPDKLWTDERFSCIVARSFWRWRYWHEASLCPASNSRLVFVMVDACKVKLFQLVFVARFGAPTLQLPCISSPKSTAFGNPLKVTGIIKKLDL
jgi:hypothetical protein